MWGDTQQCDVKTGHGREFDTKVQLWAAVWILALVFQNQESVKKRSLHEWKEKHFTTLRKFFFQHSHTSHLRMPEDKTHLTTITTLRGKFCGWLWLCFGNRQSQCMTTCPWPMNSSRSKLGGNALWPQTAELPASLLMTGCLKDLRSNTVKEMKAFPIHKWAYHAFLFWKMQGLPSGASHQMAAQEAEPAAKY